MSKIVNIQNIDPQTFELQTYSFDDTSLISNFEINNSFNLASNYVEYFIYDLNGNILYSDEDGSFRGYSLLDNNLYIVIYYEPYENENCISFYSLQMKSEIYITELNKIIN